jgi:hypothetical protein
LESHDSFVPKIELALKEFNFESFEGNHRNEMILLSKRALEKRFSAIFPGMTYIYTSRTRPRVAVAQSG